MYPGHGHRSLRRHSSLELEFRDCGTISWHRLLLTVKRWTVGMSGRRLWWGMHEEEKRSHGSQMILLRTITIASLPPHMPASAAEQKKGWVIKCLILDELQCKTPPKVPL